MRSVSWSHFRWPLLLGCTVFVASSRPVVSGLGFEGGDKVAHFAVYGLLGTLLCRVWGSGWRAAVLVYPDCGLGEAIGATLRPRLPTLMAMGALDDWTPVRQCEALLDRIKADRDLIETRIYPDAHHSFDALGLPVRYLDGVGNRSKPGGCCGARRTFKHLCTCLKGTKMDDKRAAAEAEAKKAAKGGKPVVAAVEAVAAPAPQPQSVKVQRITITGEVVKKGVAGGDYLRDSNNVVYNADTKQEIGTWSVEENKIIFNEEEEEEEETI